MLEAYFGAPETDHSLQSFLSKSNTRKPNSAQERPKTDDYTLSQEEWKKNRCDGKLGNRVCVFVESCSKIIFHNINHIIITKAKIMCSRSH